MKVDTKSFSFKEALSIKNFQVSFFQALSSALPKEINFEKFVLMFPVGEIVVFESYGLQLRLKFSQCCAFAYSKNFAFLNLERGADLGRFWLLSIYQIVMVFNVRQQ